MDLLWQAVGAKAEASEEAHGALARMARAFLEAGGRLSLADWVMLDESSRAAFAAAGQQVECARALLHGAATTPQGLAHLSKVIDGGESLSMSLLEQLAETELGRLRASDDIAEPSQLP